MKAPSRPWLFQEESVGRRGGKDQKDSMRIQLLGHLTDQAWGCGNWKQKMMKSGCIALMASWKHLQTTGGGRGRPGSELWGPSGAHTSESREIWVTWAEVFGFYLFLTDFIFRSILGLHKKIAQKIQWILTSLLPWHMDSSVISILHSVQFSSVAQSCLTLWPHELQHARPPCPSPTPEVYSNSCPSSGWCHPAISSSVAPLLLLPPIPPSIRVFSSESALLMRWPKYWSFSLSISPSNEHLELISCRMDWLDLLAVQGTLKSLLQHHSSKVLH